MSYKCAYCGDVVESDEYWRAPANGRGGFYNQSELLHYCSKRCYDKGKVSYDKSLDEHNGMGKMNRAAAQGTGELIVWILTKVLPFVAPYLGWSCVILLPFWIHYDDITVIPVWSLIFSGILGTGIGVALKFAPLPNKVKKFRKLFFWLPVILFFLIVAIILFVTFIKA